MDWIRLNRKQKLDWIDWVDWQWFNSEIANAWKLTFENCWNLNTNLTTNWQNKLETENWQNSFLNYFVAQKAYVWRSLDPDNFVGRKPGRLTFENWLEWPKWIEIALGCTWRVNLPCLKGPTLIEAKKFKNYHFLSDKGNGRRLTSRKKIDWEFVNFLLLVWRSQKSGSRLKIVNIGQKIKSIDLND